MMPQLESITLANFRSINVPVMIPLDAPVVLIHGQNGTGKTSILSGIELALTGDTRAPQNGISQTESRGTSRILGRIGATVSKSAAAVYAQQAGISSISPQSQSSPP